MRFRGKPETAPSASNVCQSKQLVNVCTRLYPYIFHSHQPQSLAVYHYRQPRIYDPSIFCLHTQLRHSLQYRATSQRHIGPFSSAIPFARRLARCSIYCQYVRRRRYVQLRSHSKLCRHTCARLRWRTAFAWHRCGAQSLPPLLYVWVLHWNCTFFPRIFKSLINQYTTFDTYTQRTPDVVYCSTLLSPSLSLGNISNAFACIMCGDASVHSFHSFLQIHTYIYTYKYQL